MKIKNWWRKLAAALVAGGLIAPSAAWADEIPLLDPSFEAFDVTPNGGFGYANLYGNTSAWIDNPGGGFHFGGPLAANWLYNSTAAEDANVTGATPGIKAAPRTGNQAMHGRGFFYSGQVTSAVFEAGMTYRFSVHAQGNENAFLDPAGWSSRVWLYLYDGSTTFSEPTSLNYQRYAPPEPVDPNDLGGALTPGDFLNRPTGATPAQSQAAWEQISIEWAVEEGAPEVGHPVGVAFWLGFHAAVDDASLEFFPTVPPLELRIDRDDGAMRLQNVSGAPMNVSAYQITSPYGSLMPGAWTSITDAYDVGSPGLDQVDSAHNWSELTNANAHTDLSEADLESGAGAMLPDGRSIDLGSAWIKTPTEDLVLRYVSDGVVKTGKVTFEDNGDHRHIVGDLNTNGFVNADDWQIFRSNQHGNLTGLSFAEAYRLGDMTGDGKSNHPDFAAFKAAYEAANGPGSFTAMLNSVPEPTTFVLITMASLATLSLRRRVA